MVGDALIAAIVFLVVLAGIVSRKIDEVALALLGVVAMVVLVRGYSVEEAFSYIDWDIMAILFGMWVITGYMIRGGLAEAVVDKLLDVTRDYKLVILLLALAAGFLSILVDNVLVILIFGAIALDLAKKARADPILAVLLIGFSANFMGTAMLMGDLPPQLLHSIAGVEFLDFLWWRGKPSSFPLLTLTFLLVTWIFYRLFLANQPAARVPHEESRILEQEDRGRDPDKRLLLRISLVFFALTILGMALRPRLGVPLGFITVSGAAALAVVVEILRLLGRRGLPGFPEIIGEVEWRALLFYASLFSLVGGLQASGLLEDMAGPILPYLSRGLFEAYTVSYWMVGLLSMVVEHDALLLTFLYMIRDAALQAGIDPHPLYWGMAWSATLASNATTAAAPALYIAVVLLEKDGYRVSGRTFLRYSLVYAGLSLLIMYIVTVLFWLH